MSRLIARPPEAVWPIWRIIGIRLAIYVVVAAIFFHYIYFFGENAAFYNPSSAIVYIVWVFLLNLALLFLGHHTRYLETAMAVSYAVDILLITRIVLVSGGLNSLFIPFYLPILIMASVWLPRSFTAIFPSLTTLGISYIGVAHIAWTLKNENLGDAAPLLAFYSPDILLTLRILPQHFIVASILALSSLFFMISYLASVIGARFQSLRWRMEEAERNLSRFSAISAMAAGLAHEIRNPLASLRSAIQEIGESFPENSQNHTLTNIVIAESDRLDRIIGRFLDFSREEILRPGRCRLGKILDDTRTMLLVRPEAGALQVILDIRSDPEISCDADRVREIFLNLALNAAQAVGQDGGRLEITLDSSRSGLVPGASVIFKDNGPGIGKETSKRIFDPFYSSKPNGGGMGLALSRKHISLHNGRIEVGNNPEGGAFFRVWLPLDQSNSAGEGGDVPNDTVIIIKPGQERR